jgi:hypothetical protein
MAGIVSGAIAIAATVGSAVSAAGGAAVAGAAAVGGLVGGGALAGAAMIASGIGMTMSVVGAVTKNKTLRNIGLGFSAAGALTGLGAATGLFDGMMSGTQALGDITTSAATTGTSGLDAGVQTGFEATNLLPSASSAEVAANAAGLAAPLAPGVDVAQQAAVFGADTAGNLGSAAAQGVDVGASIATQPGTMGMQEGVSSLLNGPATAMPTSFAPPAPMPTPAPMAPVAPSPSAVPGLASDFGANVTGAHSLADISGAMTHAKPGIDLLRETAASGGSIFDTWAKIDPSMKAAITMVAGQTAAGGIGGIFTGMQADKQMELQKLINDQNRQQWNLMFARSNTTPGLIQYDGRGRGRK